MDQDMFDWLKQSFNEEKFYFEGGYYRFRKNKDSDYELAYLVPCTCGSDNVHPQITLKKINDVYRAIKLIDYEVTPPVVLSRDIENQVALDNALHDLLEKFKQVKK